MAVHLQLNEISVNDKAFDVNGTTFTVRGSNTLVTAANLEKLQRVFAKASEENLKLLKSGRRGKEQPLTITFLTSDQIFRREGYGTGAYYGPVDNDMVLPANILDEDTAEHELNHAISDFVYVASGNTNSWDAFFDTDRSSHPIRLAENQQFCKIPKIPQYRSLTNAYASSRSYQESQRLFSLRYPLDMEIQGRGIRDAYYCSDYEESAAVAHFYTGDRSITGIKTYLNRLFAKTADNSRLVGIKELYSDNFLYDLFFGVLFAYVEATGEMPVSKLDELGGVKTDTLIPKLFHSNARLREFAAKGLRMHNAQNALPQICAALEIEGDDKTRKEMEGALAELVERNDLSTLVEMLLEDNNPPLLKEAVKRELGKYDPMELNYKLEVAYTDSTFWKRQCLGDYLLENDPAVLARAIVKVPLFSLSSEDQNTDKNFIAELEKTPSIILEAFQIAFEGNPSILARVKLVERSAFLSKPVREQILWERIYNDSDEKIVATAIYSLGRMQSFNSEPILREKLRSSSSETVRLASVNALGEIILDETVPGLIDQLKRESSQQVRLAIIDVLARSKDPRAVKPLKKIYFATKKDSPERGPLRMALVTIDPNVNLGLFGKG